MVYFTYLKLDKWYQIVQSTTYELYNVINQFSCANVFFIANEIIRKPESFLKLPYNQKV